MAGRDGTRGRAGQRWLRLAACVFANSGGAFTPVSAAAPRDSLPWAGSPSVSASSPLFSFQRITFCISDGVSSLDLFSVFEDLTPKGQADPSR